MSTKALCIVAHPDDETIWMGGTILKNSRWDWTIFSLCRASDPDRAPKFKKACEKYNAKSIISNLNDKTEIPLSKKEITDAIIKNLTEKKYDFIFTHGKNGEYGHIRHKEIHKTVKGLLNKNLLSCKKAFFFSYKKNAKSKIPLPNKKSDKIAELSQSELNKKKEIITSLYGFPENSFEHLSCSGLEAFTTK
jgi:LmbE family N-acetylglucosaminyl deacetylase